MAAEGAQDQDRELAERLLRDFRKRAVVLCYLTPRWRRMADAVAESELAAPVGSLPSPPSPPRSPDTITARRRPARIYALPRPVAIMHIRRHERTAKSRPSARKPRVLSPLAAAS